MDVSPGCIHGEEGCEAMLSQMTSAMRKHPTQTEHSQYTDVYLTLPTHKGKRHDTFVSHRVLLKMEERIKGLVQGNAVPPVVKWKSGRPHSVKVAKPRNLVRDSGPLPLFTPLTTERCRQTVWECFKTQILGKPAGEDTVTSMSRLFPLRSQGDAENYVTEVRSIITQKRAREESFPLDVRKKRIVS